MKALHSKLFAIAAVSALLSPVTAQEEAPSVDALALAARIRFHAGGPKAFVKPRNVLLRADEYIMYWDLESQKVRSEEMRQITGGLKFDDKVVPDKLECLVYDLAKKDALLMSPTRHRLAPRYSCNMDWLVNTWLVFAPYRLNEEGTIIKIGERKKDDPKSIERLEVSFDKHVRPFQQQRFVLLVESDSGKITATEHWNGKRLKARYKHTSYKKSGKLKLCHEFMASHPTNKRKPKDIRFSTIEINAVKTPKDAWTRMEAVFLKN